MAKDTGSFTTSINSRSFDNQLHFRNFFSIHVVHPSLWIKMKNNEINQSFKSLFVSTHNKIKEKYFSLDQFLSLWWSIQSFDLIAFSLKFWNFYQPCEIFQNDLLIISIHSTWSIFVKDNFLLLIPISWNSIAHPLKAKN